MNLRNIHLPHLFITIPWSILVVDSSDSTTLSSIFDRLRSIPGARCAARPPIFLHHEPLGTAVQGTVAGALASRLGARRETRASRQ